MKYCPSCNVKIEGNAHHCPLCQNGLMGEATAAVYPSVQALKKKSLLYKLQLFIFLSLMLISLTADFIFNYSLHIHYSLIVAVWVIGGQLWLLRIIHHHNNASKVISSCGWATASLVFLTFWILDLKPIYLTWILPGIALVCEILHFIFMMIDKSSNAMIYLLIYSCLCIAIGGGLILYFRNIHHLWVACILFSIISLIGAIIFKGRSVHTELVKRFHI